MNSELYSTIFHSGSQVSNEEPNNLSLVLGNSSFMFAIYSSEYKKCKELGHIRIKNTSNSNSELANHFLFLINNFQLLQKKFEKVNVTLFTQDFTLIPEAFSENSDAKAMLSFTNGKTARNNIKHHKLNGLDYSFSLEQILLSAIENSFQSCSIKHSGAVAINLCSSHHSLLKLDLFLNVHDSSIEITLKENNSLKFYNNFHFENNEDILYYLLFTMEQFGMNPLLVKLGIAGQVETTSELARILKKYIKNVSFCAMHPSVQLDTSLSVLPSHFYFTLLNQHLCEL